MTDLTALTDEQLLDRWSRTCVWLQDAVLGNAEFPQSTIDLKDEAAQRYEAEMDRRGLAR